mmetsp:Transcript_104863/g.306260  ORF Transcript_104863/g.306260 Transcript_104863/m.306260 type:complete len:212 (+) Transcript_104863:799-1434(+)
MGPRSLQDPLQQPLEALVPLQVPPKRGALTLPAARSASPLTPAWLLAPSPARKPRRAFPKVSHPLTEVTDGPLEARELLPRVQVLPLARVLVRVARPCTRADYEVKNLVGPSPHAQTATQMEWQMQRVSLAKEPLVGTSLKAHHRALPVMLQASLFACLLTLQLALEWDAPRVGQSLVQPLAQSRRLVPPDSLRYPAHILVMRGAWSPMAS